MTAAYATTFALLGIISGVIAAAATPHRLKFTLAAVIGTAIGLFIDYCAAGFFDQRPFTSVAIMLLGCLAGSGLVFLRRRVCRD